MTIEENFLYSARKQFEYYKSLAEKTIEQLPEAELFWKYNPDSNSIAVIVNHLSGNMRSRWTDFLTADGEKQWRERDREFEDVIKDKSDLLQRWTEGWHCLFLALDGIHTDNFETPIYIRNQAHTIMEAINRQLCHYAYHVGQIVMIGKMLKASKWQSLSVPRGKSDEFNQQKSAKGKHRGHFTDEFF